RSFRRPRPASAGFQPGLEALEDRAVPAFLAPTSYGTGLNPAGVTSGDFNGDGHADLAVVNQATPGTVSILFGNGDGTFQPAAQYPVPSNPTDARAGDFNGDGKLDLVVVSPGAVNVLLGNGDGTFAAPVSYPSAVGSHTVTVADFNNDGQLD